MFMRGLSVAMVLMLSGTAFGQETPVKPDSKPAVTQPAEKKSDKLADLMVGDKAPALTIEKWVKGEPVTGFEKGKIYVVEFWATWCMPCVAGFPHLSEVQAKYKDKGLTIIGVSCRDTRGNTLEKVETMVKDKGDKMAYTVAWDTERKTNESYMKAAKQNFIPAAFVVDKEGMLAWVGNPNDPNGGFETAIEEIVAGKHDLKAAAEKYKSAKADEIAESKIDSEMFKLQKLAADEKWDEAITLADSLMGQSKAADKNIAMTKFQLLLIGKKDYPKAYEYANELATKYKDDAMVLNAVAWSIVDPEAEVEKRDADVAMKIAAQAVKVTNEKDGMILDTLARCYWLKGDKAKAIELQKKAVTLSPEEIKAQIEATLKEYEKGK